MPTPYTKEQIAKADSINLIEYALKNRYKLDNGGRQSLHVKNSGGLYLFRDRNRFYHFSTGRTGGPIDFIMQFEGKSFVEAVRHLIGEQPDIGMFNRSVFSEKKVKSRMILPDKETNSRRVYWYLCSIRGIDPKIVTQLLNQDKIYQQKGRGNCVFIGYDENRVPKYCSKRGTSLEKAYKGDVENSDKSYPFSMEGSSDRVFVLESPIDVMSHATLTKINGIDFARDHRISLGGLSDASLEWYLKQHTEIKSIIFALDNDIDGKKPDGLPYNYGQEAAKKFCKKYEQLGYVVKIQIPEKKDFNEELMAARNREKDEQAAEGENEEEDEYA